MLGSGKSLALFLLKGSGSEDMTFVRLECYAIHRVGCGRIGRRTTACLRLAGMAACPNRSFYLKKGYHLQDNLPWEALASAGATGQIRRALMRPESMTREKW